MKHMQNELIEEQDQHLDEINEIATRLKKGGVEMNKEIDKQGQYIGELHTEIDSTTKKLNFVQDKLGKLLKTNGTLSTYSDMGQICTILILFVILVVMIFLVIYT